MQILNKLKLHRKQNLELDIALVAWIDGDDLVD
jgi:hypothetical protein